MPDKRGTLISPILLFQANILHKYGLDNKARELVGSGGDRMHGVDEKRKQKGSSTNSRGATSPAAGRSAALLLAETVNHEDEEDFIRIQEALRETVKKRILDQVHAILHAVDRGDAEEVRRLLHAKGIEPSWADYDGKTMLHFCAAQGKYGLVEILLEEGANKNATDRWNRCPLQEALDNKHFHVVEVLNRWNAKIATHDAGSLCEAAATGDLEHVRHLLKSNSDASIGDYDSRTPLMVATANGHHKVVELLLRKGADVNAFDRWGNTALLDAINNGSQGLVTTIVHNGGKLPQRTICTQLCDAASKGDVSKLRMLMDCGLNPDVADYDFRTPLHLAASGARVLAVSFLLGQGADVFAVDRWGCTPLDDALRGGTLYHDYGAKLIHMHGGQISGDEKQRKDALERMDRLDVKDVRNRVKTLLSKGVDRRKPHVKTDTEVKMARELANSLIEPVIDMRAIFDLLAQEIKGRLPKIEKTVLDVKRTISALVDYEDNHLQTVFSRMRFESFLERLEDADEFDGKTWLGQSEEVTDEQFKLYQELDSLDTAKPVPVGKAAARHRARFLQHLMLKLSVIGNMHACLEELCAHYRDYSATRENTEAEIGEDQSKFLSLNSLYHMLSLFVSVFLPLPAVMTTAKALMEEVAYVEQEQSESKRIPLYVMISRSEKFRDLLMNEESKAKVVLGAVSVPHVFR